LQVPPYVIFPDSTLMEMSRRLPRSEQDLRNISGVGEAKLARYGSQFLQAIGEYINEQVPAGELSSTSSLRNGHTGVPLDKGQLSKGKEGEIPSHLVTLNLYSAGKTLAEIARERNLSLITVQGHFVRCHQDGHGVDWDAFISAGEEELVLAAIRELGAEKLKPLKEALPEEIDYFTIRAVICKHNLGTEKVG
ncbi:MAG TPA: helix-turn-helix domain-containing protein, partial [Verrucomicrobiae bacterium]|nr:helix-turn-helix domain-containing protein [Verrucomicrobiae bacterium]